jgi:deazaflavin-dependent oxidoreductase (nitroreductase family)
MVARSPAPASGGQRRWRWKFAVAFALALIANAILWLREAQRTDGALLARLKVIERQANPLMLRLSRASPLGLASLEHRGRSSGAWYATPLLAARVPPGFLIGMPYGERSDWVQNLLAAGEGYVTRDGVRSHVGRPRLVAADEALPQLPPLFRLLSHLIGLQSFMALDLLPEQASRPDS